MILSALVLAVVASVYQDYLREGGFAPGDDLGDAASAQRIVSPISYWQARISGSDYSKPVAWFVGSFAHYYAKGRASIYITLQLLIWFAAIGVLATVLRQYFGPQTAWMFMMLGPFPFFASATMHYHTVCFHQYALPVLLWSVSVLVLRLGLVRSRPYLLVTSHLILCLALLSSAIVLPFLVISALLPGSYVATRRAEGDNAIDFRSWIGGLAPVAAIAVCYFVFYIYGYALYTSQARPYAAQPLGSKSVLQALYYYVALAVEVPVMLLEIVPHLPLWRTAALTLIVLGFLLALSRTYHEGSRDARSRTMSEERWFLLLVAGALASVSVIFLISQYPASTFGFYNRMLLPAFLLVSILMAWGLSRLLARAGAAAVVVPVVLWISAMAVQVDHFIDSWQLREYIARDISDALRDRDLGSEPVLLANVPFFLSENYNNVEVAFTTWSFEAHLRRAGAPPLMAYPICARMLDDPLFNPNHNIQNKLREIPEAANLWYYEYEEAGRESVFKYLGGREVLEGVLDQVREARANDHPIILRERIRLSLKRLPWIRDIYLRSVGRPAQG